MPLHCPIASAVWRNLDAMRWVETRERSRAVAFRRVRGEGLVYLPENFAKIFTFFITSNL